MRERTDARIYIYSYQSFYSSVCLSVHLHLCLSVSASASLPAARSLRHGFGSEETLSPADAAEGDCGNFAPAVCVSPTLDVFLLNAEGDVSVWGRSVAGVSYSLNFVANPSAVICDELLRGILRLHPWRGRLLLTSVSCVIYVCHSRLSWELAHQLICILSEIHSKHIK